jgi:hypothetical protein
MSDLRIIHETSVTYDFKVRDYKLIGTVQWGLTFNLITSYVPNYYEWLNAKMIQFTIINDKIVSTPHKGFFDF